LTTNQKHQKHPKLLQKALANTCSEVYNKIFSTERYNWI